MFKQLHMNIFALIFVITLVTAMANVWARDAWEKPGCHKVGKYNKISAYFLSYIFFFNFIYFESHFQRKKLEKFKMAIISVNIRQMKFKQNGIDF